MIEIERMVHIQTCCACLIGSNSKNNNKSTVFYVFKKWNFAHSTPIYIYVLYLSICHNEVIFYLLLLLLYDHARSLSPYWFVGIEHRIDEMSQLLIYIFKLLKVPFTKCLPILSLYVFLCSI